ncbi:hypothetical protein K5D43_17490 [Pseudomonas cichorii]|nr:hypothetical protein [Pseudomonas cichorii]MBX8556265.1 hypothetical protein [Pseudomonas cichorii]
MPRLIAALLALVLMPTVCLGSEGDDQANSFDHQKIPGSFRFASGE